MKTRINNISGFGLIEVLLSVAIMSVGLLGLASLQARSMLGVRISDNENNANLLLNEMAQMMQANAIGASSRSSGNYITAYSNTSSNLTATTDCTTSTGCTYDQMANNDVKQWKAMIENSLPNGEAQITQASDSDPYVLTIRYDNVDGTNVTKSMNVNLDNNNINFRYEIKRIKRAVEILKSKLPIVEEYYITNGAMTDNETAVFGHSSTYDEKQANDYRDDIIKHISLGNSDPFAVGSVGFAKVRISKNSYSPSTPNDGDVFFILYDQGNNILRWECRQHFNSDRRIPIEYMPASCIPY